MNRPPKISVLIPAFRQAIFLDEAIQSVIAQDFSDWELVISDDSSDDASHQIIQAYAQKDKRIRAFRQKINIGMGRNWNFCLEKARGEAVKMMGGDDLLETRDCLSRQWDSLQQPGVVLAACARRIVDHDSRTLRTIVSLPAGVFTARVIQPQMLEHDDNLIGEPVCCLFRRADGIRKFQEQYLQATDLEMWFHLLENGGSLAYDPEPRAAFRKHPGQNSSKTWPQDLGWEHLRLIMTRARSREIPRETRLAVLFRSEAWRAKHPRHHGVAQIQTLAAELARPFSRRELALARIRHHLGKTAKRWRDSLRKRLVGPLDA